MTIEQTTATISAAQYARQHTIKAYEPFSTFTELIGSEIAGPKALQQFNPDDAKDFLDSENALASNVSSLKGQLQETHSNLFSEKHLSEVSKGHRTLREAFSMLSQAGIVIDDIFGFQVSEGGKYKVSGYGLDPDSNPKKGMFFDSRVALPNQDKIESIINGTSPEHAELSKKIRAKLDEAWGYLNNAFELRQNHLGLYGSSPDPAENALDAAIKRGAIISVSMLGGHDIEGESLSKEEPKLFNEWRNAMDQEKFNLLSPSQVYAQFFRDHSTVEEQNAITEHYRKVDKQDYAEYVRKNEERIALLEEDLKFYQTKLAEADSDGDEKR